MNDESWIGVLNYLERIATALEMIASQPLPINSEPVSRTAFPWSKMSTRVINVVHAIRNDPYYVKYHGDRFQGLEWPWSCEDLFTIGCSTFMEARNFGDSSALEVHNMLAAHGFDGWMGT